MVDTDYLTCPKITSRSYLKKGKIEKYLWVKTIFLPKNRTAGSPIYRALIYTCISIIHYIFYTCRDERYSIYIITE